MFIKLISYVPAILGVTSIGFFVLINNPKSPTNRIFATLNFLFATWLLSLFIADISTSNILSLWALKFALFFGELASLAFYIFSLYYPFRSKFNSKRQLFLVIPMLILSILLLTSLGVSRVSIQSFGVQPEQVGALYTFSDVISIIYLLMGVGILAAKYRRSTVRQKNQIRFVLYGLIFALIMNIFTGMVLTLLKVNTDLILFGSFSLFIFSLLIAYSMIKHGFFEIRLIVARTLGYVFTLSTIAVLYAAIVFGLFSLFIDSSKVTTAQQLLYIAVAVFLSFTFQPIKQFFNKFSNRLFYRDAYDSQVLLDTLNKVLVSTIDVDELLTKSAEVIATNLKASFCTFVIKEDSSEGFRALSFGSNVVAHESVKSIWSSNHHLKNKVTLPYEMLANDELLLKLKANNVGLIARISQNTKDQSGKIAFLLLGSKQSGNQYNDQDVKLIEIITDEFVIAIQNALRFEEIRKFNITLQEKVDDATHKLRATNEKLRQLDQTKDDFISMASHQLRTPLTSVKGYVSMVLDEDAGKVTAQQRKLLDQAFISSQRMVYLIADLLNVSRLKTGKFVIEAKPTNLADVVGTELEQLKETAKSRGLKLEYQHPKNFPSLNLDETKIRQVIMNFSDNAIYYTPTGGTITVGLEDKPESIELTVSDNGIGVPKAEQHHLFTKFYRAGNAKKARPDGTGLGLFMAQKVIVAQGGAIIFHSEENKGSTFGFSFPKAKLLVK